METLIISTSLNPGSRSALLAERAAAALDREGVEHSYIDLREWSMPMCDGDKAVHDDSAKELAERIRRADAVILAVPVYNFYANAAAKNLIELTGRAWERKLVGFVCAAGGEGSYMAVMALANSLMLDFRCLIVPRFVFATRAAHRDNGSPAEAITQRIEDLCREIAQLGRALKQADWHAGERG